MKANELTAKDLRIGNYVGISRFKDGLDDYEIHQGGLTAQQIFDISQNTLFIDPIPITEQWLIDFGFEKTEWDKREYYLRDGYFFCSFKYFKNGRVDLYFAGEFEKDKTRDTIYLKYVHQLQNLYWCLCGKELELSKK